MRLEDVLAEEQVALLRILSGALFGRDFLLPEGDLWEKVVKEARMQAVPLLIWDAAFSVMSEEQRNALEKYNITSLNYMRRGVSVFEHHGYLHRLMEKNGIEYCVLKGSSSAYYYPKPLLRAMGDVDFLVPKTSLSETESVLQADGFKKWEEDHICHVVYRKGKMHYELHFEPSGMPDGRARDIVLSYLEDIFERAESVSVKGIPFVKTSDFHHGLVLLLHTYHHMLSEGVGLRHLCDIAVFMNHFSNEEFKEMFYEKLSKVGLWRFAQIMGQLSHLCLEMPYKEWMGEIDEELCIGLCKDIFDGGNFGAKDEDRKVQGIAISNRGKDGVEKGGLLQTIKTLNRLAEMHWSVCKNNRFFHMFGWIPMGFRFLGEVFSGKRKMPNIVQTMRESGRRKELYEKFELFKDV